MADAEVSAHSSRDKAFEIFVKRTITSIQKEAWGRSKEVKEIREACQAFLNRLEQSGAGDEALREVLYPLQLACASNMTKVVELALGCLHKLVAHAWLHGESGPSGSMELLSAHGSVDGDDTVAQVIKMVIKCGETTNEALQLAVVRALLTFTTAEHFVAHGDCLLAAVRAVFNLALSSEDPVNKRTACNALLQMLNTIAKRVTQPQPRGLGSECSAASRTISEAIDIVRSTSIHSVPSGTGLAAGGASSGQHSPTRAGPGGGYPGGLPAVYEAAAAAGVLSGGNSPTARGEAERAAQFASLAERSDLRGLEAALEAGAGEGLPDDIIAGNPGGGGAESPGAATTPTAGGSVRTSYAGARLSGVGGASEAGDPDASGGPLSPPASVRGSSAPGDPGNAAALSRALAHERAYADSRRGGGGGGGAAAAARLTTYERDVLLVLTAFCKLASREAGASSSDSILNQGKLLALEMLGRVLGNPQHTWAHVSELFCRHLRQPLCLALLRNCAANDPAAYALAVRLLAAILSLPRLRLGLRAELGAFYPLLVLRPLEQDAPNPQNLADALGVLRALLAEPQLIVDLFVNYDCDLQASNLYERTVQALSKLAQQLDPEPDKGDKNRAEALARGAAIRREALQALLRTLASLEAWAAPIREGALRAAAEAEASEAEDGGSRGNMHRVQGGSSSSLPDRPAPSSLGGASSEAERFTAAKTAKDALARGLSVFNAGSAIKGVEYFINCGLVDGTPTAIAEFLRRHADQLDKAAIGELLGHHTDLGISVMHAWVDGERYGGQSIDLALRALLAQFRLPGEAQKIDRIMEKFAERYCKDNPGRFRNADAAYTLAFAIIMLNTDAHNPLAERRLAAADFVTMNFTQTDAGMEPALPVQELEGIYERIVSQEIIVRGEQPAAAPPPAGGARAAAAHARNRLAAAAGWTQLSLPLRKLGGWDKQRGADAERRLILEMAEKEVAKAALSGNVWHAATHAEHARPMLQVSGRWMLDALAVSYARTEDPAAAEPLLAGLLQLARLAGLLGLDGLCEQAVGALASAAGVFAPAPPGSAAERLQLSALHALLALPAGPEAGLLGSSWVIVLRCVSALEGMCQELTRPLPPPPPPPAAKEAAQGGSALARMFGGLFGGGGASTPPAPATPPAHAPPPAMQQQQLQQQLAARGGPASPQGASAWDMGPRDSMDGGGGGEAAAGASAPPAAIRLEPGAGLAAWVLSPDGRAAVAHVYARSAALDGDGVVVFMRALCAVSQEELEGAPAGGPPRLHSLQKVVECAFLNMGRIRLVWAKVWAVVGAQLVGASCHPSRAVALYAVDALRQLVAKLLARAELAHFTHQEDALRPFVAVLRQCDEPAVRELAVQCVMQAVAAHPRGLGSGWRMATQALRLGAADGAPAVMAQAQEALQVVVDALYRADGGHECMRETVQAVVAGIRNPAHLELSISAVQLLQRCGDRLAAWEDEGHRDAAPAGAVANAPGGVDLDGDYGWGLLLRTLSDVLQHDRRPQLAEATMDALFALLSDHSAHWDEPAWRVLLQRVVKNMLALPQGAALDGGGGAPGAGGGAAGAGGPDSHQQQQAAVARAEEEGLVLALLRRMDRYFPLLCEQIGLISEQYQADLIRQLASISMAWYHHASQHLAMAGLGALLRLATTLAAMARSGGAVGGDAQWAALLDMVATAARDDVATVVALARQQRTAAAAELLAAAPASAVPSRLLEGAGALHAGGAGGSPGGSPRSPAAYAARLSQQQGQPPGSPGGAFSGRAAALSGGSLQAARGSGDRPRRATAGALPGGPGAPAPPRIGDAQLRTLRVRARQLVLLQRALGEMHARCLGELSWGAQLQLLGVLRDTVAAAMAFNTEAAGCDGAAPPAAPEQQQQQQQQQQPAGAKAAPPGAAASGRSFSEAPAMYSAYSATSSISVTGLVEAGGASFGSSRDATASDGGAAALAGAASGGSDADAAAAPTFAVSSAGASVEIEAAEPLDAPVPQQPAAGAPADVGPGRSSVPDPQQQQQQQQQPGPTSAAAQPVPPGAGREPGAGLTIVAPRGAAAGDGGSGSPSRRRVPELLVTSVESSEVVGLALMRLEVEGGTQLIQGLTRSLERGNPTPAEAQAARERLHRLCRDIIAAEAACSTSLGAAAQQRQQQQQQQQQQHTSAGAGLTAGDDPMRDVLHGTSWEHAVRVPLVVLALDTMRQMAPGELRDEVRASFPSLARLVCSNHAMLRGALARLMGAPEVVAMVTAAAAAAAVAAAGGSAGGGGGRQGGGGGASLLEL